MIRTNDLIALFQKVLDEHWGYIYGQAGAVWTEEKQRNATRTQTVQYGRKWIGHPVTDCSGLFSWAFKKLGGYMVHGSNAMWTKYMASKGALRNGKRTDGQEMLPGTAVFKNRGNDYYHVGLFIGDGAVIEAKGTSAGVIKSTLGGWTAWGEMKGVEYARSSPTTPFPAASPIDLLNRLGSRTLKHKSPTMKGDDIAALQEILTGLGFSCGTIDGIFGKKTEKAVKAFQHDRNLVVDGIVGASTRAALIFSQI